jgi:hypothetical protein
MLFQKSIMANSIRAAQKQWDELQAMRKAYQVNEGIYAAQMKALGMVGNEGIIPRDVYQEFDNVTVTRFRSDDGDTFLNDLIPLSKSVNIGKLVHKYRKASDAGLAQTSMTGQTGVKLDSVNYNYDGSIIPIHDIAFGRNFREFNAQRSEGFDALIDDQRECVATLRVKLADNFLDGHKDKDGNLIVVDGLSWGGIRNDSRVAQVDLGAGGVNFDFTDTTKTYAEIEAAFKQVRDVLYITNNCAKEATYYISREMMSNFERNSSESYSSEKIINRLSQLMGVAAIKVTNKLTGNELMAFPLQDGLVRPVSGMAINTVALPRSKYNDDYAFVTWGAVGFEVRTDFANRKCALYASA